MVETAWINVRRRPSPRGESCDHTRAESAFYELAGYLVAGVEAPEISEPGSCGLHLVFGGAASPAGAPAALADHALVVTGRRADGARFETAAPFPHGIDVRAIDARYGETNAAFSITADVAAWFSALDLAAVAPDPDGVVRLGEGDAATLDFERGVSGSLEVFVDANADGALDAAELAAGPIARSGP
ncbi:MAG: hypothetical protein RID81_39765 [Sandaracinaceae bacterium]